MSTNETYHYVVYDLSGAIIRRGQCSRLEDVKLQTRSAGENVAAVDTLDGVHDVFHTFNEKTHKVEEIAGRAEGVVRLATRLAEERTAKREDLKRRLADPALVRRLLEQLVDSGVFDGVK